MRGCCPVVWLEARTGLGTMFQFQVTPWQDKTGIQTESHKARISDVREHIPGRKYVFLITLISSPGCAVDHQFGEVNPA